MALLTGGRPSGLGFPRGAACAWAAATLLLAACQASDKPAASAARPAAVAVAVFQVRSVQVPVAVEAVGQAEGAREVEVRAQAGGILLHRIYQEGAAVKAGDPLFQIDPAPYRIALQQAEASLAQAQARLAQSEREASRMAGLVAVQAVSQKDADDADSARAIARANVAAAEAAIREAQLNLGYTEVRAPVAGMAGRAAHSEGALITTGTDSLLTSITQVDPVWVRFSVPDTALQPLRSGAGGSLAIRAVEAILPDGSTFAHPGHLNYQARVVDPRLSTVELRAEFANPGDHLLPGQFVRIRLLGAARPAFLVPQTAVLQGEQGRFVYVLSPTQTALPRPVIADGSVGSDWVVVAGLKTGETVIADNLLRLRPGAAVQVQPAPSPAVPASASATAPAAAGPAAPAAAGR